MPKLSDLMKEKMGKTMPGFIEGTLNIGKSKKRVFKKKQAIATGRKMAKPKGY